MSCVKYNNVIDASYEPVELGLYPVSLDQMKRHLYLLFDSEGGYSVDDDDTYINQELIPAAVQAIEKYTGQLLRPCTVEAILRNEKGGQALPYGPVTSFDAITDENGDTITDYKLQGLKFKTLATPLCSYVQTEYTAGYEVGAAPGDLIMAVLHQGAFLYASRGDQQQQYASADVEMSPSAKRLAKPYRRILWLL